MLSRIPTIILWLLAAICFSAMAMASSLGEEGMVTDRKLNLIWVADASHARSAGFGDPVFSSSAEAQEFIVAMNEGRLENFGRHDWRLASEWELGRLYQAYANGTAPAGFRNFSVFRKWFESARLGVRGSWGARGDRSGGVVFGWPVRAALSAPEGFEEVAVFASNSALINRATSVNGDVVANNALSGPTLDPGFTVSLQRNSSVDGDVKGDTVVLNQGSSVGGTVFHNQLTDFGSVPPLNTQTPLSLPVFADLPVFQPANPGTGSDVSVAPDQTVILAPGRYDQVSIDKTGTLVLSGQYDFGSVVAIGTIGGQCAFPCRSIQFTGPSDVRVAGRFDIGAEGSVQPQVGSGISAANLIFYISGVNGGAGTPAAVPAAFTVGQGSTLLANVWAPNGTILIDRSSTVEGGLFARDVHVERDSTITLNSIYANQPPTADPQTVFTNGSPIVITLTGSDPENQDLTFAIETFPPMGTGMVSSPPTPIVPDPVPNPDDPDCENFDPMNPDPDCETSQPPITSATVTFTPVDDPMAEGDLESSFTFSVTDPGGLSGTAVVSINPPGDETDPPDEPVDTVVAVDGEAETSVDVPLAILLEADAPEETVLTFAIEEPLPMGTLVDSNSMAVETARDLPSPNLTYTPPLGFTGTDTINFSVRGEVMTVEVTDFGTFTITVNTGIPLAPDQNLVAAVNTPISITLIGNSGGFGDGTQSLPPTTYRFAARGPYGGPSKGSAFPPDAEIAGNVSDANGDGIGDGRDDLPGPAPVLIAAGVDVNLGATPSGSVTDPAGDATDSPSDDPDNPDLVSASVGASGGNLNLSVRFVASGFNSANSRGSFVLDTDENPATGFPGIDAANNDDDLMGIEYLVNIGANLGANAEVFEFVSLPNNFTSLGTFSATVLSDGYDVSIPLSVFNNDDGRLTFKAETQSFLGSGFTGILDYAPDVGLAPGQSSAGVQGVARIQIEWDIPSLGAASSDEVVNAMVVLQTEKGTVDSLPTNFYVGTGDQDGLLTVSDFQAPASVLTGVVMPVPRNAQTGDQGTFSFDVTNAFKAALDDPSIDHFSIQGRVDETLAGQGFKRGLQIRSTADSNLNGLAPVLSVFIEANQPASLVWTVTKLPLNGVLRDSAGNLVTVDQVFLSQPTLTYFPDTNFEGTNTIEYTVDQGGLIDTGIISVVVTSVGSCEDNEAFCDDGRTSP